MKMEIKKYSKYKLFRKYITSDGINYIPIADYQAFDLDLPRQEDCGYFIDYDADYFDNSGNIFKINGKYYSVSSELWQGNRVSLDILKELNINKIESIEINNDVINIYKFPNISYMANMEQLFYERTMLKSVNISNLDTSNVTNMRWMFGRCTALTELDLSNFNTSNVTDMDAMFADCHSLSKLDISTFDTSKVTTMWGMFAGIYPMNSLDLSNFNTSNVTNMSEMFRGSSSLSKINFSSFDTSNVTDMNKMFYNCSGFTALNLSNFITSKVNKINEMFWKCTNLTELDLSNWDISNVTDMNDMFYDCNLLKHITMNNCTCKNIMKIVAETLKENPNNKIEIITNTDCPSLKPENYNLAFEFTGDNDMFYTFNGIDNKATYSPFNVNLYTEKNIRCIYDVNEVFNQKGWHTNTITKITKMPDCSQVTNMTNMFKGCVNLISINLSNFDTSNCINMYYMFYNCYDLPTLDLSSFDTSSVTNMGNMFEQCRALTDLNLSSFNTSNVTDMSYMFESCFSLPTIDLSNFDTSKVTTMHMMFENCHKLVTLDLSNFNTSKVTTMSYMFNYCKALKSLDLSNFDTSNVTYMSGMFKDCESLTTLDLSNFIIPKGETGNFINGCYSLKTIIMNNCSCETINIVKQELLEAHLRGVTIYSNTGCEGTTNLIYRKTGYICGSEISENLITRAEGNWLQEGNKFTANKINEKESTIEKIYFKGNKTIEVGYDILISDGYDRCYINEIDNEDTTHTIITGKKNGVITLDIPNNGEKEHFIKVKYSENRSGGEKVVITLNNFYDPISKYEIWEEYDLFTNTKTGNIEYRNPVKSEECGYIPPTNVNKI